MKILEGKTALITGVAAKRGMGHAIALKLASEGADLIIVDKFRSPKSYFSGDEGWKGLDDVADEIKSLKRDVLISVTDIQNSADVDELLRKSLEKFGKIDILIHCAAIRGPVTTPITELEEKIWREVLDVNLNGTFLIAKAVAKSMVEKHVPGKIVLIASLAANRGVPGSGSYCASKWGVLGLMKTMALELAKYKINVNAINPGTFGTHLRDDFYMEQAKAEGLTVDQVRQRHNQQLVEKIPLGRIGVPEDVANLAFFLVTEQSNYITGQAIDICGGWGLTH